ncbi:hypothetical protein F511_25513 [Dorcoceras hygrometricum]|uniref:RING-type E3 ubiquitin transferase n=1 Tax=Dorcoceras hygrometricum TaxID=472368 RepID=A0A2Z7D2W5_9LAMI|nr:hypothetical protein F511_25513 [Dorcoceras hygrometricum]
MPPAPTSSPNLDPAQWDPQVIGLVGLICSLFILLSYYKMLYRNARTFRVLALTRSSTQRRRINEQLEEFTSQFQSRGLDSCIMHSLPITQIKKTKDKTNITEGECAVCLGEFDEDEWVKHLPSCSHFFHVSCIDTWFQTHSSCPLCRSSVLSYSSPGGYPISILEREDFHRERLEHYQVIRSQILLNTSHRTDEESGG